MKIRIYLLCFYFLLTLSVPTIKMVKMAMGCESGCNKEQRNAGPKGCQKGKCILNFHFNTGQFIAQEVQSIAFKREISAATKEKLYYDQNLIPNYTNIIWHPPKNYSFTHTTTLQS